MAKRNNKYSKNILTSQYYQDRNKYSPTHLRELRIKKGVGRLRLDDSTTTLPKEFPSFLYRDDPKPIDIVPGIPLSQHPQREKLEDWYGIRTAHRSRIRSAIHRAWNTIRSFYSSLRHV